MTFEIRTGGFRKKLSKEIITPFNFSYTCKSAIFCKFHLLAGSKTLEIELFDIYEILNLEFYLNRVKTVVPAFARQVGSNLRLFFWKYSLLVSFHFLIKKIEF